MSENYTAHPNWVRRSEMEVSDRTHHYIVLSYLNAWMVEHALPQATGNLLDYGSGGQPYRKLFETNVDRYVTADVAVYGELVPDILLRPNEAIDCKDGHFDTILSTQTLEHVEDPDFYLNECARVIKQGGTLILTAPMQWRHHEIPYDYFRYTRFGLETLLSRNGFSVQSIKSTGGAFALIGQILLNFLNERGVYRPLLYKIINRSALWLDRRFPDGEDVINWMVIAKKTNSA
ncbi:class I SAM-dependent methyltransferase [Rhizobium leguminosarum]|nr:methyltransferase domain-containing protein [Rhizobium leguminosarum bv. viciae]TBC92951.1 class I SAM-dependent methyltransferase [Rhizobium leguminosarum]